MILSLLLACADPEPPALAACLAAPGLSVDAAGLALLEPLLVRDEVEVLRTAQPTAGHALLGDAGLARIRAETREQLDLTDLLDPARRLLLLYPADDAVPLTRELVAADPRPITLVLPDGSWRQAAKIGRREPVLRDLPRVTLPSGPPSRYRLRAEPMREGLATFEAAARALGVIEGPAVRASLERTFDAMVEATLLTRKVPPRRW